MLIRAAVVHRARFIMGSWLSAPSSRLKEDLISDGWMNTFSGDYWAILSSVPDSYWVFCDSSSVWGKNVKVVIWPGSESMILFLLPFLLLSQNQVNLRKFTSKTDASLEKLSRRHGLWGGREPEHSHLLLEWLFPAVFASKVHAVTIFSRHAFAIADSMETHLCKAERPAFKTYFSYDAENNILKAFFSHSTGLGR